MRRILVRLLNTITPCALAKTANGRLTSVLFLLPLSVLLSFSVSGQTDISKLDNSLFWMDLTQGSNPDVEHWKYDVQVSASTLNDSSNKAHNQNDNTLALSAVATFQWIRLRATAGQSNLDVDQLFLLSPEFEDLLNIEENTGSFVGFGVELDQPTWFVGGEITQLAAGDKFSHQDTLLTITGGVRYGNWTPSFTYEYLDGGDDFGNSLEVPSLYSAQGQGLFRAGLPGLQPPFLSQFDVMTATLRYDYAGKVELKADISRYSDDIETDKTLLRLAVNYVF